MEIDDPRLAAENAASFPDIVFVARAVCVGDDCEWNGLLLDAETLRCPSCGASVHRGVTQRFALAQSWPTARVAEGSPTPAPPLTIEIEDQLGRLRGIEAAVKEALAFWDGRRPTFPPDYAKDVLRTAMGDEGRRRRGYRPRKRKR